MGKIKSRFLIGGLAALLIVTFGVVGITRAEEVPNGLSVSPTTNKIVLMPGDEYVGKVTVHNPSTAGDWITLSNGSGVLQGGESADVEYKISVPESAPAGGQYAAIVVATVPSTGGEGVTIREVWQIAMPIYASVAGESKLSGTIGEINMPSFLLNPPLEASFIVENTGNVHTDVTYYTQVFPLFSDEEIYTNEENPGTSLVMPGTKRAIVSSWDNAPQVGVFRVVYTVKAFGGESVMEKTIIICPIWLLFIIFFAIFALIFYLVLKAKARKKAKMVKKPENA